MSAQGATNSLIFHLEGEWAAVDFSNYTEVQLAYKVFTGLAASFIPVAVSSNVLVFFGMLLYPGFYSTNNVLMMAIAGFDFLMGAVCLPLYILCYTDSTKDFIAERKYLCLFKLATPMIASSGALYLLMLLSVDRYIAIMFPFRYHKWMTFRRGIYVTCVSVVFTLGKASVPTLGWNYYNFSEPNLNIRCNFYTTLPRPFIFYALLIPDNTAIFISVAVNVHIAIIVFRQLRSFKSQSSVWTSEQKRAFQARISSVKITLALMVVFIVLTTPFLLVLPFKLLKLFPAHIVETIKVYASIVGFANSTVNGPIYAAIKQEYRSVYMTMLVNAPWNWKSCLKKLYREINTSLAFSSAQSAAKASTHSQEPQPEVKAEVLNEKDAGSVMSESKASSVFTETAPTYDVDGTKETTASSVDKSKSPNSTFDTLSIMRRSDIDKISLVSKDEKKTSFAV